MEIWSERSTNAIDSYAASQSPAAALFALSFISRPNLSFLWRELWFTKGDFCPRPHWASGRQQFCKTADIFVAFWTILLTQSSARSKYTKYLYLSTVGISHISEKWQRSTYWSRTWWSTFPTKAIDVSHAHPCPRYCRPPSLAHTTGVNHKAAEELEFVAGWREGCHVARSSGPSYLPPPGWAFRGSFMAWPPSLPPSLAFVTSLCVQTRGRVD